MKRKHRILSFIMTVVLCFSMMHIEAFAVGTVASGTCGEKLTWELSEEGTLTIEGSGAMFDWSEEWERPWSQYTNDIKKTILPEGITNIGECAFCTCVYLTDISIPDSITSIGTSAFAGSGLEDIKIPDSVTFIGDYAFAGTPLYSIVLPDRIKTIGEGLFNRSSISSVSIPDGVTSIGDYAFAFSYLSDITIPDSVTSIGANAFLLCDRLVNITIPDSVTSIGVCAFEQAAIESIEIPNSVTRIEEATFSSCQFLTSVKIPNSVTSIGVNAFHNCGSLITITIPDNVISIGDDAFSYCTSLESITIPDSVTSIGSGAFYDCNELTNIYYSGSEEDWNQISFGDDNEPLQVATVHFNSNGRGNELDFSKDVWNFKNYSDTHCYLEEEISDGYFKNPYIDNLKPSSRSMVLAKMEKGSEGGHCFGMCATVILQKLGLEDMTQWDYVDYIRQIGGLGVVRSRICFYQAVGHLLDYSLAVFNFSKYSPVERLEILADKADKVKSGGSPVLLAYELGDFYHAVVAYALEPYALERGPFISSTTGREYDHRILIYDPNSPEKSPEDIWDEDYCLLFNRGTDEWEIPAYNEYNISSFNGAQLRCATDDTTVFDAIDDVSQAATSELQTLVMAFCLKLYNKSTASFMIRKEGTDQYWLINTETNEITGTSELFSYRDIDSIDGSTDSGLTVVFPDDGTYTIEPASGEADKLNFSVFSADKYLAVESSSAKGATVSTNGSISLNDKSGDYKITIASDEAQQEGCYDTYAVSGSGEGDLTLSVTNEGVKIEGDNIQGAVVNASNAEDSAYTTITDTDQAEYSGKIDEFPSEAPVDPHTEHTYQTVTTKATLSENGSIITKCLVCGEVKSKSTIYRPKAFTLSRKSFIYNGKTRKPSVKIVDSNGKVISDSNYKITYSSGLKKVGKYSVKITFKGNYSGTKTLYYKIVPKGTTISKLTARSEGFTVRWRKQAAQTTGYQIRYSMKSSMANAKTVTVSKTGTVSKKVTKLKAKKKYYVQVRTYKTVNGVKYYSSWSAKKTVTTKN